VTACVLALGLLATACQGGPGHRQALPTTVPATVPVPPSTPQGDIAVASEQEPACLDWISSCNVQSPGVYGVEANTLPRAYDYSSDGVYKPSILITGEAQVTNTPNRTVTYIINPRAVWNDGQPITSTDFNYTWQQIMASPDAIDKSGYSRILSVDDSDPRTAVVTFTTPYSDWKELFGGRYGIYPSHILLGQDRNAAMANGYTWSGGPWKIDHWTRGVELKLVPNGNYWGKKPDLNSVTIKFFTDQAAEVQAYESGQVLAAYPNAQTGMDAFRSQPGTTYDAATGLSFEGLWFNVQQPPLDSKAVRQALAYATDRTSIAQQMFLPIQPGVKPINSFYTPAFPKAYSEPFAKYRPDVNMVDTLMAGDGWVKGTDGIWAKGTERAVLELKTADSAREVLAAQILQTQWLQAGFQLTVIPESQTALRGTDVPQDNFQIALLAHVPSDDDSGQCSLWCSKNIPTAANSFSGDNFDRISDPTLDRLWTDNDTNLDQNARLQDASQGQATLADLVPAIPLAAVPDVVVINTAMLAAEGGRFLHNFMTGPYTYLNTWFLR
jgi:peptide/nickel transport system substrate-binding protein